MNNKIDQIPVDYRSLNELRKLICLCIKNGFSIHHGLDSIRDDDAIVAVVIDIENHAVFKTSVTCMSCWSNGVRRPMYANELVNHFNEFVMQKNLRSYNKFIKDISKDASRPIGGIYRLPSLK